MKTSKRDGATKELHTRRCARAQAQVRGRARPFVTMLHHRPSDRGKGVVVTVTYKLQRLSDYSVIPSTERLIDPYLPLGGQIVLAALPKTFKTYVGLSWACCVATGQNWLGHPVKKGKVRRSRRSGLPARLHRHRHLVQVD